MLNIQDGTSTAVKVQTSAQVYNVLCARDRKAAPCT